MIGEGEIDHGRAEHRLKIKITLTICVTSWLTIWWFVYELERGGLDLPAAFLACLVAAAVGGLGWYGIALGFADMKPMAREVGWRASLTYLCCLIGPALVLLFGLLAAVEAMDTGPVVAKLVFMGLLILFLVAPVGAFWFTVQQSSKMASLCYNARLEANRIHAALIAKRPSDPQSP